MENMGSTVKVPGWFRISAVLGLLWNAFGVYQYLGATGAAAESLAAMGMTPGQIALQTSLPAWMTGAFAIAVFGGLAGSISMLFRRAWRRRHLRFPCSAALACFPEMPRSGSFRYSAWRRLSSYPRWS